MKPSRIIILLFFVAITALLIISVYMVLSNIKEKQLQAELKTRYKEVKVTDFNSLEFDKYWDVKIRKGQECRIQLEEKNNPADNVKLVNIDGRLIFSADTVSGKMYRKVRISMPDLKVLKATYSTINIEGFEADSVSIHIENGTVTGKNNDIKKSVFHTSGSTELQLEESL